MNKYILILAISCSFLSKGESLSKTLDTTKIQLEAWKLVNFNELSFREKEVFTEYIKLKNGISAASLIAHQNLFNRSLIEKGKAKDLKKGIEELNTDQQKQQELQKGLNTDLVFITNQIKDISVRSANFRKMIESFKRIEDQSIKLKIGGFDLFKNSDTYSKGLKRWVLCNGLKHKALQVEFDKKNCLFYKNVLNLLNKKSSEK